MEVNTSSILQGFLFFKPPIPFFVTWTYWKVFDAKNLTTSFANLTIYVAFSYFWRVICLPSYRGFCLPLPIQIYCHLDILKWFWCQDIIAHCANLSINVESFLSFGGWYISHLKEVSVLHSKSKCIVTWKIGKDFDVKTLLFVFQTLVCGFGFGSFSPVGFCVTAPFMLYLGVSCIGLHIARSWHNHKWHRSHLLIVLYYSLWSVDLVSKLQMRMTDCLA